MVRLGITILPEHRWADAEASWRWAEELGFAHAWTYDHLSWRELRDGPWFAAIPTLTAAAMVTSTIELGTLVATPNFRHPLTFARELLTLDDVSGGRAILGLGAGTKDFDATVLGQPELTGRQRFDRFAEFASILDRLLSEPETDHAGEHYTVVEGRTHPGSVRKPRPPFVMAGNGPRSIALAGQMADGWVTTGPAGGSEPLDAAEGAAAFAQQCAVLDDACVAVGRDPADVGRYVYFAAQFTPGLESPARFVDTVGRYAEAGATDLVVPSPRGVDPLGGYYAGGRDAFEAAVSAVLHP